MIRATVRLRPYGTCRLATQPGTCTRGSSLALMDPRQSGMPPSLRADRHRSGPGDDMPNGGGNWRTLSNSPSARAPDDGKWNEIGGMPDTVMTVIPKVEPEDVHKAQLTVVETARAASLSNAEVKELLSALGIGERVGNDDDGEDNQ